MGAAKRVDVGCELLAEFVDRGESKPDNRAAKGEPVRPASFTEFKEVWSNDFGTKEFTILLHGGKTVTVRGHAIKPVPASGSGTDDSFGVIVRAADKEDLVAIFKAKDIDGIFHGTMRIDQTAA